jgi:phosphocarrier protein HPr
MSAGSAHKTTAGGAASSSGTARRIATICNQKGLHARAAVRLVKTAEQFDAEVRVRRNGTEVPCTRSEIMELLLLAAASGTTIELTATGREAEAAVNALARLIECKFDED